MWKATLVVFIAVCASLAVARQLPGLQPYASALPNTNSSALKDGPDAGTYTPPDDPTKPKLNDPSQSRVVIVKNANRLHSRPENDRDEEYFKRYISEDDAKHRQKHQVQEERQKDLARGLQLPDQLADGTQKLLGGQKEGPGQQSGSSQQGVTQALTLSLMGNWQAYSTDFDFARFRVVGKVCILSGVIRNSDVRQWQDVNYPLFTLPEVCRPSQVVVAVATTEAQPVRLDIFPDGRVFRCRYNGCANMQYNQNGFITLSNVLFVVGDGGNQLTLADGHSHYLNDFQTVRYLVQGPFCFVSGLDRMAGSSTLITTLPSECRPQSREVFRGFRYQSTVRVDVYNDGAVRLASMEGAGDWISLSTLVFPTRGSMALPFAPGVVQYRTNDGYGAPRFTVDSQVCVVSGIAGVQKYEPWQVVAVLPAQCRPTRRIIFWTSTNSMSRVDIFPDGAIRYMGMLPQFAEGDFIALDNVAFFVDK